MRRFGIRLTDNGCEVAGAPRWIPLVLGVLLIPLASILLVVGDTSVVDAIFVGVMFVIAVLSIRLSVLRVTIGESGVLVRNILRSRRIPWSNFKRFAGRPAPVLGESLVVETNDGASTPIQLAPTRTVLASNPDIARLVQHLDTVVHRIQRSD